MNDTPERVQQAAALLRKAVENVGQRLTTEKDPSRPYSERRSRLRQGCIVDGQNSLREARQCLEHLTGPDTPKCVDSTLRAVENAIAELDPLRMLAEWYDGLRRNRFNPVCPYSTPEIERILGTNGGRPCGDLFDFPERLANEADRWLATCGEELKFRSASLVEAAEISTEATAEGDPVPRGNLVDRLEEIPRMTRKNADGHIRRALEKGILKEVVTGTFTAASVEEFMEKRTARGVRTRLEY